jgi:pullulanase
MVRKFILDSIRFWMEEYHIDGFRFDLMGILDIDTMKEVRRTCNSIQEGTLIIGEGWNLNTPLPIDKKAIIRNQSKLPDIAQFNDKFRDKIKGNTFYLYDKGYVLGNEHYYEEAKEVITGSVGIDEEESGLLLNPSQSVNYVECHDNHTMWDKLISCLPDMDELLHIKYHRLATGLVVLSQGIPFLHSGQEFFRTKRGDGNSYKSPDHINRLDWNRKKFYSDNVNYIKGLIQIRKQFPCFRLKTGDTIRECIQVLPLPIPLIGYSIQNENHDITEVLLLINPTRSKQSIQIPDGKWSVLADAEKVGISSKRIISGKEMVLEPVCLTILAKK